MVHTILFGILSAAIALSQTSLAGQPSELNTLTGHVVTLTGNEPRPVRRAKVTLTGGGGTTRVTHTDTMGAYRLDRLTAGDYRVRVEKPGFVTLETRTSNESTHTLQRGGAIEGTVADPTGDPIWNIVVSALQLQVDGKPNTVAQARTDDLGRYRLPSLPAGDYYVEAATDEAYFRGLAFTGGERWAEAFYPAASAVEDAKAVRVALGRDTNGVDLTFAPSARPGEWLTRPAGSLDAHANARIAGRVVDAASGKPIWNARLRLLPVDGQVFSILVKTDAQGRFAFSSLPARRYTLSAEAERFVTLEFGQQRPGEKGTLIQLRDRDDFFADFRLPRASALEGTVLDEFGDPAPNVMVRVARKQYAAGRQRLMPVSSRVQPAPTDDQGHYRISAVPPGDYYVTALTGAYAGTDEAGGFALTYYPGLADSGTAAPVTIALGIDSVASFSLISAKTVSVSGTMVHEDGQPGDGIIWMTPADSLQRMDLNRVTGSTAPDGRFVLNNVPAGSYTMQGFGAPKAAARGAASARDLMFGWLPIAVGDSNLENVILQVKRGVVLHGKIVLDDTSVPPPKPDQLRVTAVPVEFDSAPVGQLAVAGIPIDFGAGPAGANPPASETHADLTFEVGPMWGVRRILVSVASPNWALEKIIRNEIDITDTAQDFRTKNMEGVEVVLTSRVSRITGGVSDDNGPLSDYAVVFFPTDPTKWIDRSRFVMMARSAQDGRFDVRGLPPEDYLVIALPNIVGSEWQDPDFLQQLRSKAASFALTQGESKNLELKLKKRP